MLILHSAPQLNPISGNFEQSTEFVWPNRANASPQLLYQTSNSPKFRQILKYKSFLFYTFFDKLQLNLLRDCKRTAYIR